MRPLVVLSGWPHQRGSLMRKLWEIRRDKKKSGRINEVTVRWGFTVKNVPISLGAFLWDDPKQEPITSCPKLDQWSEITQMISHHCASKKPVNTGSFAAQWSEWSRINDPISDHHKGMHPLSYMGATCHTIFTRLVDVMQRQKQTETSQNHWRTRCATRRTQRKRIVRVVCSYGVWHENPLLGLHLFFGSQTVEDLKKKWKDHIYSSVQCEKRFTSWLLFTKRRGVGIQDFRTQIHPATGS